MEISTNNGIDYSDLVGTADAHLHQYGLNHNDTLHYVAQGCFNGANCINSTFRLDTIDITALPPTSPNVFRPLEGNFSGNIQINYTESMGDIGLYNITLVDGVTFDFIDTIALNDDATFQHLWVNANATDGVYRIGVDACDTGNICSIGFSAIFVFDREIPEILFIDPAADQIFTNASSIFTTTCNDTNLFGFDFAVINETGIVFVNTTRNLNTTFFQLNNTINFSSSTLPDSMYSAQFDCLDGHTTAFIDDISTSKGDTWLTIGDFTIDMDVKPDRLDYNRLYDRYSIDIEYKSKADHVFTITSMNKIYVRDSKYSGHLVSGKYWFDTEPYIPKSITQINDRLVEIVIQGDKFNFNSIGIINNVSSTIDFSVDTVTDILINISPANNTLVNSTNPVMNFTYDLFVEPSTVDNCSIIINGTVFATNLSAEIDPKGENTFRNIYLRPLGTRNVTYKYSCFTSLINVSDISITQINSSDLRLRVVLLPELGITGALSLLACPSTTAGIFSLVLITIIALFFIGTGMVFRIGFIGFFGTIMMMVVSWYISPCQAFFALIMALFSLALLIWFVVRPSNS